MKSLHPTHPIEVATVVGASLCFGAAVAVAAYSLFPVAGVALMAVSLVGGVAGAVAAFVGLGLIEPAASRSGQFALTEFPDEPVDSVDQDELLLVDAVALVASFEEPDPESRVVRLFKPDPIPAPGELASRIDDFLGEGRPSAQVAPMPERGDASEALHAALADIRRSLG